jgi:hypothetical protein
MGLSFCGSLEAECLGKKLDNFMQFAQVLASIGRRECERLARKSG